MPRPHLRTVRGQLVVWYLAVLALLLLGLSIFQWITLNNYLRSTTASSVRNAAFQELQVLGPCDIQSQQSLRRNAETLARLLGTRDTPVAIVDRSGQVLATRRLASPGRAVAWHVPSATLRQLVSQIRSVLPPSSGIRVTTCPRPAPGHPPNRQGRRHVPGPFQSLVSGGNILVAVPLGPIGNVFGYAILGRSLSAANATVARVLLVFLLGALLALALAALVALPMINRALRPLRRVTVTAEAIAAGHLEERANLAFSPDEIGRLGEAFDTMVDRLQEAIDAAASSEERMRQFLADASHELRTPVTVLRGASQVLLKHAGNIPPDEMAALRDMHDEAARLARLIDDLLTLSRLDARQPLAPETVNVRHFLHELIDRYARAWPDRAITLDDSALDGGVVDIDPEALRRVVTNLVDNAARYSRPEGAITITGQVAPATISISVSDEGPGLSAADAARVFDRFYRTKRGRKARAGTGLGLAIVRGLVEQSRGSIQLDTGPDRGTTVTVTLPRTP